MYNSRKLFLLTFFGISFITFKTFAMDQLTSSDHIKKNELFSLTQNTNLDQAINFQGNCTLDGKGFELSFASNTFITIAANSTLCLKNVTIKDVDQKIKLASNTSKISIAGYVTWKISEYFKFEFGSFNLLDGARFDLSRTTKDSDKSVFLYTTDQISILNNNAAIELENIIFSYCPKNSAENLISLISLDSCIYLNNSNLFLGKNLRLIKGCIYSKGANQVLANENRILTLGDGKDRANDTPLFYAQGAPILKSINVQILNHNIEQ